MDAPDKRALLADFEEAPFRIGVEKGRWDLADPGLLPEGFAWPMVVFWIAAAPREGAPDRFYIRLDCEGYPTQPPTGTFWDPETKQSLAVANRPKGKERVGLVFRTDWQGDRAFYHPYDRVAAQSHPDWPAQYPHQVWTREHSIVDLLSELHALLNCADYTGL